MSGVSPYILLATFGPLAELFVVMAVVAVFALLRSQADRRAYFRMWEKSWAFLAVALTAGLFHERFVDPESVFYPAARLTTQLTAIAYMGIRIASVALVVGGVQLYAAGTRKTWLPWAAIPVAVVLSFLVDTAHVPLGPLAIAHGPVVALGYVYAAIVLLVLPQSRRSGGTRLVEWAMWLLAALALALTVFYVLQRADAGIAGNPWLVRFARYGFYLDLLLQGTLAWTMVRLLLEDSRRESADARAQLRLVQDRAKLGDLYDVRLRLLGRRAFETMVGLDFARASFGSVVHVRITNLERVQASSGPAVADELLAHIAGVLDSALRQHDRVYRWDATALLVVMPRAVPAVARSRVEFIVGRAAPLTVTGVGQPLRPEAAVSVRPFTGGEDLTAAAAAAVA